MLERMAASDAAWDGRFFTGVRSTGIYCLPSCRARKPQAENVVFVATTAEARSLGLRPCLRCRPDDFVAGRDLGLEQVEELVIRVRRDLAAVADVAALVRLSGWGLTHLHELFRRHYHSTPAVWLERERATAARDRLLAGERPSVVADGLGYQSTSTFHQHLLRHTGLAPGALARLRDATSFRLQLPADLLVEEALAVLGRDPASPSERRDGLRCLRALTLDGHPAAVALALERPLARGRWQVEVTLGGLPGRPSPQALSEALTAIFAWFGLPIDPRPFVRSLGASAAAPAVGESVEVFADTGSDEATALAATRAARGGRATMPAGGRSAGGRAGTADSDDLSGPATAIALAAGVRRLVGARPGLRAPRMSDPWEALVWAVLGQQVHLQFALALRRALVELAGRPVPGTTLIAPPTPAAVAALDVRDFVARRSSRRKAEVLASLGAAVAGGELALAELARGSATRAEQVLLARSGIGPWTAGYVGLRGFGFADSLPAGDSAIAAALLRLLPTLPRPDAEAQRALTAPFSPHRSLLTMHLWLSLGDNP